MTRKRTDPPGTAQPGLFAYAHPITPAPQDRGPLTPQEMTPDQLRALQAPYLEARYADQARRGAQRRAAADPGTSRRRDVPDATDTVSQEIAPDPARARGDRGHRGARVDSVADTRLR